MLSSITNNSSIKELSRQSGYSLKLSLLAVLVAAFAISIFILQKNNSHEPVALETQQLNSVNSFITDISEEIVDEPVNSNESEIEVDELLSLDERPVKIISNNERSQIVGSSKVTTAQSGNSSSSKFTENPNLSTGNYTPLYEQNFNTDKSQTPSIGLIPTAGGVTFQKKASADRMKITIVGGKQRYSDDLVELGGTKNYALEDGHYRWESFTVPEGGLALNNQNQDSGFPASRSEGSERSRVIIERGRFEIRNGQVVDDSPMGSDLGRESD